MVDIREERMHVVNKQIIDFRNFSLEGSILDIGGGGEGVIGRLFKERVVAIDPSKSELEEAGPGPLKIIMDAKNLQFLDGVFDNATSFFTMMYIPVEFHVDILKEVYRVLKPGGMLYIWDIVIPERGDIKKDYFVVPIKVYMESEDINTGYGTKWEGREQNCEAFAENCCQAGFDVVEKTISDLCFKITLKKAVLNNTKKQEGRI